MTCDISTLIIALQLARGLVAAPEVPTYSHMLNMQHSVYILPVCTVEWRNNNGVITQEYLTKPERLRCQADLAEKQEADARLRLADYNEFQRLADKCSQRVAGSGTVIKIGY